MEGMWPRAIKVVVDEYAHLSGKRIGAVVFSVK
jgi:hypothetical protein